MALCRTGSLIFKIAKPIFYNRIIALPSSVTLQKRYAARKGYREMSQRKKKIEKLENPHFREKTKLIKKYSVIERTFDLKKPEPPDDDVFISTSFNYVKYSLPEIINFHREYHHPTVFNNPDALVTLKIELNMIGKKETQFLKPFSGIASIPHPFTLSNKREVLVICKPEDVDLAYKSGATIAGGIDLIKKIKDGAVQPFLFEYIIAHTNMISELNPIRNELKLKFPKSKTGTLTNDLKSAIYRFLHGVEYTCVKVGDSQDFGIIDLTIGTLDMEINQLEENFTTVIKDIELNKPKREGKFISWIWCHSPPSNEQFSIDLTKYIESETRLKEAKEFVIEGENKQRSLKIATKVEDDDDDDDEDDEKKKREQTALK